MVVVKCHRHPVIREHQEGQGAAVDLDLGDQVADESLKECLIRDPCGAEEAHHIGTAAGEIKDLFDRAAAQAPPLAADLDLKVLRDLSLQTESER